ncbi:MAG: low molecular weight phosphatase family protein [Micrococcales bacterium]
MSKPSVLFICVHNAGKSQTAEALMKHLVGDEITVYSGGTGPDENLAADAVAALAEIDVAVDGQFPKPIDNEILKSVDRVVILGDQAKVEPIEGMKSEIETWLIIEPKEFGIEGAQRAAMVRDEILERVEQLAEELLG